MKEENKNPTRISWTMSSVTLPDGKILYEADPKCEHDVRPQWSGVECIKCHGWFCL